MPTTLELYEFRRARMRPQKLFKRGPVLRFVIFLRVGDPFSNDAGNVFFRLCDRDRYLGLFGRIALYYTYLHKFTPNSSCRRRTAR